MSTRHGQHAADDTGDGHVDVGDLEPSFVDAALQLPHREHTIDERLTLLAKREPGTSIGRAPVRTDTGVASSVSVGARRVGSSGAPAPSNPATPLPLVMTTSARTTSSGSP
jgi:hypothetical protein